MTNNNEKLLMKAKDESIPPPKRSRLASKMDAVKRVPGEAVRLCTLPSELQLQVMAVLNPIDATCFGLTSKHFYKLYRAVFPRVPGLTTGSPSSATPVVKRTGCKYCVPVLWYPAHCELRNHLRPWVPRGLEYCMSCKLFTLASTYSSRRPWRRFCAACGEDFGSQLSICRQRLQHGDGGGSGDDDHARTGETRWPRYYGDRVPPVE